MPQIKVTAEDFILTSKYTCSRTLFLALDADNNPVIYDEDHDSSVTDATRATRTLNFVVTLPENATVTDASFHVTVGEPDEGEIALSAMNWMGAMRGSLSWPVANSLETIAEGNKRFTATFQYVTKNTYHFHDHTDCTYQKEKWEDVDPELHPGAIIDRKLWRTFITEHSSTVLYYDIYLLVDYVVKEDAGSSGTPGGSGSVDSEEGSTSGPSGTTPGGSDNTVVVDPDVTIPASQPGRLVVTGDTFALKSTFTYERTEKYYFTASGTLVDHTDEAYVIPPSEDKQYVPFDFELPRGAIVKKAYVCAKLGSGKYPVDTLTIAGTPVSDGSEVKVPVTIQNGQNHTDVQFAYSCSDYAFDPDTYTRWVVTDYWEYEVPTANNCNIHTFVDKAYPESVVRVIKPYLVIEYTMPGGLWSLEGETIEPEQTMTVKLDEVAEGYTYTMQVVLNDEYMTAETDIPLGTASASFTVPVNWLYAIPNSVSGMGKVVVREYYDGEVVNETSKSFKLVCPEKYKPIGGLVLFQPLQTVNGVTYPAPMQNLYIQNKCGVTVNHGGASAQYGATIVSQRINVGGYEGEEYNAEGTELRSGLLTEAGSIPITITITDSRGLSNVFAGAINVLPYEPPSATDFKCWRVDANGNADEHGEYVRYSFIPSGSYVTERVNKLTATLTVDGRSESRESTPGSVNGGVLFGGAKIDDFPYALELTLTDLWESVTFKAITIPPITGTTVVIRPNPRQKRGLLIGDYDTAAEGWVMSAYAFSEPEELTNYVTVPGRVKGPLNMSTVLTGGEPTFGSRNLSASFECSDFTRLERDQLISNMVNQLHGREFEITLPDEPDRYIVGKVYVKKEYSDMAHCKVNLTAVCEPWRYNKQETVIVWNGSENEVEVMLYNNGRMPVIPTIEVSTPDGYPVILHDNKLQLTESLFAGTYKLPKLVLKSGNTPINVLDATGEAVVTFSFREAVL